LTFVQLKNKEVNPRSFLLDDKGLILGFHILLLVRKRPIKLAKACRPYGLRSGLRSPFRLLVTLFVALYTITNAFAQWRNRHHNLSRYRNPM